MLSALTAARPLVLYDGTCGFCKRWIARWSAQTQGRVRFLPMKPLRLWLLGIRRADARRAMQLIEPSGRVSHGAQAVFRMLLRSARPGTRWLARLGLLPGVRGVAEGVYRAVAKHRVLAAKVDHLLVGRRYVGPASHRGVRWVFLRLLGGTFLIAFTSLGRQVLGLYGTQGIRPLHETFGSEHLQRLGNRRFLQVPSVFWLGASDRALVRGCRVGQALSVALMLNVAPQPSAALLWGLYLSYVSAGRDFLSFQWDALLLEMGLLGILTAPAGLRPGWGRWDVPAAEVALFRVLLFRLYLGSGLSKLQSGDTSWRDLTACQYHYETSPLPTRGGWYAHHLPARAQKLSTAAVLASETALPLLIFAPRRLRQLAFGLFSLLQGGIAATGNYGFFNLQSFVLGVWLLDDAALSGLLPGLPRRPAPPASPAGSWVTGALALPVLALGASELLGRWAPSARVLERLEHLERFQGWARPFRSVNSYGLFSVMTRERPEIVIEGSEDGETWKEYPFRYKVSHLEKAPRQVAPHQPRLDWQMWFAALGRPSTWFLSLLVRLLEGSPDVLALFAANPFPQRPPRAVRAVLYDYRMTDLATQRSTGTWWKRERRGLYVPPVSLVEGARSAEGPRLQWAPGV
ncbi:Predicted thiol-disulfide oxidoreductase YuxK, DCC family [Stigmatella aurantiaca]|uniref:Lipase maturation factor 2 n=1 Tax=Stigmatella aurantiaca TaxID=41 RepID=A0A1H7PMM3_STIAU|nr:lipase maturation factor family protein [Stigmatella aurantiaca]SEL36826.1 Predicted thiol-disulfide oxidoreductase YuxK, DCC family [Stigmatella aurantiaca]